MKLTTLAIISILTFTTFTANATTPCVDTSRPDKIVYIGFHIGDGASSIRQNYASQIPGTSDFSLTPGNSNTFGASALLPIRNFFGIGTGIDFCINNHSWSLTTLNDNASTLNTVYSRSHFYTLETPAYLDFMFNVGSNVQWHNELGVFFSFGLDGKNRSRSYASYTNSLGQSQVTESEYVRNYFNDDNPVINSVKKNDWGLHVGTGIVAANHFSLKAVFHAGAANVANNTGVFNISTHNIGIVFKAGYIFAL